MNEKIKEAMKDIIDFYWDEEHKHWTELYYPDDHVFVKLEFIKNHLKRR